VKRRLADPLSPITQLPALGPSGLGLRLFEPKLRPLPVGDKISPLLLPQNKFGLTPLLTGELLYVAVVRSSGGWVAAGRM